MATIVWTEHAEEANTHLGVIGSSEYYRISPRYGVPGFVLNTTMPRVIGENTWADTVDELKVRAQESLDRLVTVITT